MDKFASSTVTLKEANHFSCHGQILFRRRYARRSNKNILQNFASGTVALEEATKMYVVNKMASGAVRLEETFFSGAVTLEEAQNV